MEASEACLDLIRSSESLHLVAYLCPAGVPTIGWGSTYQVQLGQQITLAEAQFRFAEDVRHTEAVLTSDFYGVAFTQGQWDALVSLSFNIGRLPIKAPKLTAAIRSGDWPEAARQFLDITKADGKVEPGLVKRRAAEHALFVS